MRFCFLLFLHLLSPFYHGFDVYTPPDYKLTTSERYPLCTLGDPKDPEEGFSCPPLEAGTPPIYMLVGGLVIIIFIMIFRIRILVITPREADIGDDDDDDDISNQAQGRKKLRAVNANQRRQQQQQGNNQRAAQERAQHQKHKLSAESEKIIKTLEKFVIPADQLLNKKHLASGGFAEIFTCDWNGSRVAVKQMKETLPPGELDNFITEMGFMSKLRFPHLVGLIGCSFNPYYIVMPLLPRGTLHELIQDARTEFKWKIVKQFSLQVAKALLFMHSMKPPYTHRDIKSGNVLVDKDYTLKMADFGLSRPEDADDVRVVTLLCTPAWTAPEVFQRKPYKLAADVYSYAVVMWELLARKVPFAKKPQNDIMKEVMAGKRPDVPSKLPNYVIQPYVDLLKKAWDQDKDKRPSMKDIVDQLKNMPD